MRYKGKIKGLILTVWIVLLLLLYIFNIRPIGGPPKIGTREYISLIAFFSLIFHHQKLPNILCVLYLANWTEIFFSVITVVINGTLDLWYVQFAFRNILYLSGAIFIVKRLPHNFSLEKFVLCVIYTVIINDLIALTAFVNPSIMDLLVHIQQLDEERTAKTIEFGVRMIGLGQGNYFNGGVINGIGIISTVYLISRKYISIRTGAILVIFMTIIGLFIGRTTIVGTVIAFIYFLIIADIKKFMSIAITVVTVVLGIYLSGIFDEINTSHAFGIFNSYENFTQDGTIRNVFSMNKFTVSFKTLLFGDGLSKLNGAYYMETDIGWLRNIFYFGLAGTIFGYVYYESVILYEWWKKRPDMKYYILSLACFLFLLNFKGLPDYNFFLFLIIAYISFHTTQKKVIQL